MKLRSRLLLVPFLLLSVLLLQPFQALAQVDITVTCFNETGFCMAGRIKQYWDQNGGLSVFGFPISDQHQELVEGKPFQVQIFQRNRLELHPENAAPYDVLLGRLGVVRLEQQGRDWTKFGKSAGGPVSGDCLAFSETGQNVCGPFLSYFKSHGLEFDGAAGKSYAESLALFGLPISPNVVETNGSGDTVETQWFERARFEWHPNNPDPYKVELGLLGSEVKTAEEAAPPPPPPATIQAPTCPAPANKNSVVWPSQCLTSGSVFFMTIFGFDPDEKIGYWLNDPSGQPVAGTRTTYSVGHDGFVYNLPDNTGDSNYYPGTWSWVFQSPTNSQHQSVIYFTIVDEAATGIKILSINTAAPGGKASLSAISSPNTVCNLDYWVPSGDASRAQGLGKATTDALGNVTWTWVIGTNTGLGTGHLQVTCNNFTVNRTITISNSPPPAQQTGVQFITVQGGSPGAYAYVEVQTAANATCSIDYYTPHGTHSTAQGLDTKGANNSGRVSWTWKIGTGTESGTGRVDVTCNGVKASSPITIS